MAAAKSGPAGKAIACALREGEAPRLTTAGYLYEHQGQLLSFMLSFIIIASFWAGHNRLYESVEYYNGLLLWLNIAWMFTIVWLPVPTALVGSMDTDALQKVLYIDTMLIGSLVMTATHSSSGETRSCGTPTTRRPAVVLLPPWR